MTDERKLLPIMPTEKISLDGYVAGSPAAEKERADAAFAQVDELFQAVIERLRERNLHDKAGDFEVYRVMLDDPAIVYDVDNLIRAGISAPQAMIDAYEQSAKTFESMGDMHFCGRAKELRMVGNFLAKFIVENF